MKYKYKVEIIADRGKGNVDKAALQNMLDWYSGSGWRLVSSFTNEVGKNASAGGYGGVSIGTNATMDETVLIFEKPEWEQGADTVLRFPISETNEGIPFFPGELLFNSKDNNTEIAISIGVKDKPIIGVQGRATIHTIFDDKTEVDRLELAGFVKDVGNRYISNWVKLPDFFSSSIAIVKSVDFSFSKWVDEEGIHEADISKRITTERLTQVVAAETENAAIPIMLAKNNIQCPKCATVQSKGRSRCFQCGIKFIY